MDGERVRWSTVALGLVALVGVMPARGGEATNDEVRQAIERRIDALRTDGTLVVAGTPIVSTEVLPALYERRAFAPAWTDAAAVDDLLRAIAASRESGLDPADYHQDLLVRLRPLAAGGGEADADFDVLATDAFVCLAYHLRFGKVDPTDLDPTWNFGRQLRAGDPVTTLQEAIDAGHPGALLASLEPQHPFYQNLKAALAAYRRIEAAGGWPTLPDGPTLRTGDRDARVPALRRRLAVSGDLAPASGDERYDAELAGAVARFQERHGLAVDGAVGPATRRALDVPVAARIDQLRATLERCRWIMRDVPARFVLVNIAGFTAYLVSQGEVVWESRVVVGTPYTRTPTFRADMTYVVLNPTWTIPASIVRKEVLPGLRRDPYYLERHGYVRKGNQYVQPPGPRNALGRIKLMLPNRHSIYLHDTPSKSYFAESRRTFSHGCVRVQKPVELAALALDDPAWTVESLERAIATGRTRTIVLAQPLPVLILYWTAAVGRDGLVYFLPDVYDRDPAVVRALDGVFRLPRAAEAAPQA